MKKTWRTEAARKAADIVGVAIAAIAAVVSGLSVVADHPRVAAVTAVLGTVSVGLTRVQAHLTRENVFSEQTHNNEVLVATGREHQPANLVSLGDEDKGL